MGLRETMEGLQARERVSVINGREYVHLNYDTQVAMRLTGLGVFALLESEKVARNTPAPTEVTPDAAKRYLKLIEETLRMTMLRPSLGDAFDIEAGVTDIAHLGDDLMPLYAAIRRGDDDVAGFTMSSTGSEDTSAPPNSTGLPSGTE